MSKFYLSEDNFPNDLKVAKALPIYNTDDEQQIS